ncbi:MAG: hypothetical protein WC356_05510 [Candidatus Micrarchaeia archaeon]|jgi:hypothetical protein
MTGYKVRGNKELGWSIAIPSEAYAQADKPEEYTVCVMQDGTLVYQPVHP